MYSKKYNIHLCSLCISSLNGDFIKRNHFFFIFLDDILSSVNFIYMKVYILLLPVLPLYLFRKR